MKNKLFKVCLFLIVLSTLFSCFACNNNAHTHNFSFVKYNKTEHWLECSCKEKKDVVKHVIEKGKCKYCSWGASAFKVSNEDNNIVYFGSYPQTQVVNSNFIESLNDIVGNPRENREGWAKYDYYQNNLLFDCMFYKDVDYNGEKYRGVYIKEYRPTWLNFTSDPSNTYQIDNGYYKDNVYWFKYEPIEWQIVNEGDGKITILSQMAIDAQHFNIEVSNDNGVFNSIISANYKDSLVRKWLINEFYNSAFNSLEKEIINTVEVDNSQATTGLDDNKYFCQNTFDKVYFISYAEMKKYFETDDLRIKQGTDYAKCQGLIVINDVTDRFYGNACWWLRSPTGWHKDSIWHVTAEGHYDYYFHGASSTSVGVVPAVTISI